MSSLQKFITGLLNISTEAEGLPPDSPPEIRKKKTKTPAVPTRARTTPAPATAAHTALSITENEEDTLDRPRPEWYLNDRKQFIEATNNMFNDKDYQPDKGADTCGQKTDQINLMAHQRFVRDYMQLNTPYRGLLVYHGLGSGKTCTSIAIAEGIKTTQPVIVMTPASLQVNYKEELKKCGKWYRTNHHWRKVSEEKKNVFKRSEPFQNIELKHYWEISSLQHAKPNYNDMSPADKASIDTQIKALLEKKYTFINYNGNFKKEQEKLKEGRKDANPYDNRVVIIDEVHQIIGTIVKQNQTPGKKDDNDSKLQLYKYLMSAVNCKIVLLTGTPLVNAPEETAILYNMLRGYIVTHTFQLGLLPDTFRGNSEHLTAQFRRILTDSSRPGNIIDYVEVSEDKVLSVTRNPLHFVNGPTKNKVQYEANNTVDLDEFVRTILQENDIPVKDKERKVIQYKALPDTKKEFYNVFVDETDGGAKLKKASLFKQRIVGLTSYFKSQEQLMPKLKPLNIVRVAMSKKQFESYYKVRSEEIKKEQNKAKGKNIAAKDKKVTTNPSSGSYRPGSRQLCNFVFPSFTIGGGTEEGATGSLEEEDASGQAAEDEEVTYREPEEDNIPEDEGDKETNFKKLQTLRENATKYLTLDTLSKYSPKFHEILTNIQASPTKLHLVYSNWIVNGTAVLQMVLEANGYVRLFIKKDVDIDETRGTLSIEEVRTKKMFIVHTGDIDSAEERNAALDIFNGNWAKYPNACLLFGVDHTLFTDSKKEKALKDFRTLRHAKGDFAKVIFISKTGSDGISLRNVRTVHLTEPYWQLVRLEQVIGRARRICAHEDLPETEREVDVYLYVSKLTTDLLIGHDAIGSDTSEKKPVNATETDYFSPINSLQEDTRIKSSDEFLYNIAREKYAINSKFLSAMQQSAIDCARNSGNRCFTSISVGHQSEEFLYEPETPSAKNAQRVADQERIERVERKLEAKTRSLLLHGTRRQFYEIENKYYYFYEPLDRNYETYLVKDQVILDKLKRKYMKE